MDIQRFQDKMFLSVTSVRSMMINCLKYPMLRQIYIWKLSDHNISLLSHLKCWETGSDCTVSCFLPPSDPSSFPSSGLEFISCLQCRWSWVFQFIVLMLSVAMVLLLYCVGTWEYNISISDVTPLTTHHYQPLSPGPAGQESTHLERFDQISSWPQTETRLTSEDWQDSYENMFWIKEGTVTTVNYVAL